MDQQKLTKLGNIVNLRIIEESDVRDPFSLIFLSADGERHQIRLGTGAMRLLWHYLTEILYPRAASSLTSRSATASTSLASSPSAVFAVKVIDQNEHIEVVALSTTEGWSFYFSHEEGYELWTLLEDILHNVQSRAGEQSI